MVSFSEALPSLSAVEAFVHTAERRSFRKAAKDLGISPAAVSKAVARLEGVLGAPLLNRTTRHVSLTPEGALYLRHCRDALRQLEAGRDLVSQSLNLAAGTLRVSASFVVGRALTGHLDALIERHPRLVVELTFTDEVVNLVEEEVDVVVRVGDLEDSSLVAHRLRTPRWTTVASPTYLARFGEPNAPEDLEAHRCLKFKRPGGTLAHWQFRAAAGDMRIVPTPTSLVLNMGDLLLEGAAQGLGVCQVFDFMVEEHVRRGSLVEVLGDYAVLGPPLAALCLPGRHRTPRVRAFLDYLDDILGGAP